MFKILDGRDKFYQWDIDRRLIVEDDTITQVHFANCLCFNALVCEVYEIDGIYMVDVPNIMLQECMDLRVWAYDGGMTKHCATFEVVKRAKPDDYVYTETEVLQFSMAIDAAREAEQHAQSASNYANEAEQHAETAVKTAEEANTNSKEAVEIATRAEEARLAQIDDTLSQRGKAADALAVVEKLAPKFSTTGNIVECKPMEHHSLNVISDIEVIRSGSGTVSPENIWNFVDISQVKLTRCGKNLFGGDALANQMESQGAVKNEADGTIQYHPAKVDRATPLFTKFKPNTQYTFILYGCNCGESPTLNSTNMCIRYTDDSLEYFDFLESPIGIDGYLCFTSKVGKTIAKFGFSYATGETRLYYDKCGIFEGVITVNDFEPYQGDTFTMDLGQSIYGGSLDWTTGTLTSKYYPIVFDGVSSYRKFYATDSTAKTYAYIGTYPMGLEPIKNGKAYCNCSNYVSLTNRSLVITINKTYTGVADEDDRYTVVNKFNALAKQLYDAGTPLIAVYELETPTTIQLTPQEIKAISGINTLYSNTGNTAVSGRADLIAVIEELQQAIISLGGNI